MITYTKVNIIKWISSLLIITSMLLTAFNIYPLNLYIAIPATIGWMVVSFVWKENSLIAMNVVALGIYLLGIFNYVYYIQSTHGNGNWYRIYRGNQGRTPNSLLSYRYSDIKGTNSLVWQTIFIEGILRAVVRFQIVLIPHLQLPLYNLLVGSLFSQFFSQSFSCSIICSSLLSFLLF